MISRLIRRTSTSGPLWANEMAPNTMAHSLRGLEGRWREGWESVESCAVRAQHFPAFCFLRQGGKTGLQTAKAESRYVKLEAARKQWHEPTLLPEQSLSWALQWPGTRHNARKWDGNSMHWWCGDIPVPWSSLLGPVDKAVGSWEEPLWVEEGPSTDMHGHRWVPVATDTGNSCPGPSPWHDIWATHNACGAQGTTHGPETTGLSVSRKSLLSCEKACTRLWLQSQQGQRWVGLAYVGPFLLEPRRQVVPAAWVLVINWGFCPGFWKLVWPPVASGHPQGTASAFAWVSSGQG